MKVVLIHPNAKLPKRATKHAAGADVYSCEEVVIQPSTRERINLGFKFVFDYTDSIYLKMAPRSGLSLKGIDVVSGVIDCDYTGVLSATLINNGKTPFIVSVGDRIAQIIIERISLEEWTETLEQPKPSIRGTDGYGSTGL